MNPTIISTILTALTVISSISISAQPPWEVDTVHINETYYGLSSATFSPRHKALNANRYYQYGRAIVTHEDGTRSSLMRVMDFETGEMIDLKKSLRSFPQEHMDTLNMKTKSYGELVHYANNVSTYWFRKSVNYSTVGYYFAQYHHVIDGWSDLIYAGPSSKTQYMRTLGCGMKDNYFYYAHAMQDSVIQPDPNYAHEYHSTRYKLERLDLKNLKIDTMFTLHMPKREMILHFEEQLFTPDGKLMVILEYDDNAYEKYGPNDPPPVAYIIDVETNEYKTVEIPWTPYGKFVTPDSKYLFVGSYLTGEILKIDLQEAKVVKKTKSTKTIFDFYMAPSGNYFMVTYNYEKMPRKVVDFRSTEDLSLLTSMQLETLFGKGAKYDMFGKGLYGRPILSSAQKKEGEKDGLPLINHLPEYIGPAKPGSPRAIALAKAESIAKAKQYMKDRKSEFTKEKYIPENLEAVSFATDGNVIISAERYLADRTTATYVAKLSPSGKRVWETKIPGKEGATSSPGCHYTTKDGGCIVFTRYYHKWGSFGCSRITRIDGAGKIIYDYKFIREPNPGHKDVDWEKVILEPDGSLKLEGLSFVERKQFGQGDWRNLYTHWTGTMSSTGTFTDTTVGEQEPREKSYWWKQ